MKTVYLDPLAAAENVMIERWREDVGKEREREREMTTTTAWVQDHKNNTSVNSQLSRSIKWIHGPHEPNYKTPIIGTGAQNTRFLPVPEPRVRSGIEFLPKSVPGTGPSETGTIFARSKPDLTLLETRNT